jgi:hypothetical protein
MAALPREVGGGVKRREASQASEGSTSFLKKRSKKILISRELIYGGRRYRIARASIIIPACAVAAPRTFRND